MPIRSNYFYKEFFDVGVDQVVYTEAFDATEGGEENTTSPWEQFNTIVYSNNHTGEAYIEVSNDPDEDGWTRLATTPITQVGPFGAVVAQFDLVAQYWRVGFKNTSGTEGADYVCLNNFDRNTPGGIQSIWKLEYDQAIPVGANPVFITPTIAGGPNTSEFSHFNVMVFSQDAGSLLALTSLDPNYTNAAAQKVVTIVAGGSTPPLKTPVTAQYQGVLLFGVEGSHYTIFSSYSAA